MNGHDHLLASAGPSLGPSPTFAPFRYYPNALPIPANAQSATNAAQQFAAAQALQQAYSAYTFAAQTLPVHQSLSNPSHHHHQQQQLPQSGAEAALKNEELQPPQQSQPLNFWGPQQWQEAYWPRGTFLPGAAPTPEIGLPQSMALGPATSALPQLASSHCASSTTQPPQFFQPIGYNYNNSVSAASSTAAQQWLLCGGAKREAAELLESEEKASGAGTGADNNCQLPTDVHQQPTLNFPYRQQLPRRQFGPGTNNLRVRTKDQYRIVYTEYQRLELEREFHQQQFINTQRKAELSSRLHLTERQIKIWFQNRRAKERRMNKRLTEPNYSTQQIRSNTF